MTPQKPRTIDEARLLANLAERAERLFQDGYSLTREDEHDLVITNEEGSRYYLSTLFESCTCPCYKVHKTCKHWLGAKKLEADQREYDDHLCSQYVAVDDYARAVYEESLYRRLANGATI